MRLGFGACSCKASACYNVGVQDAPYHTQTLLSTHIKTESNIPDRYHRTYVALVTYTIHLISMHGNFGLYDDCTVLMVAAALSTFVGCVPTCNAFDHTQPRVRSKPYTHVSDSTVPVISKFGSILLCLICSALAVQSYSFCSFLRCVSYYGSYIR